MTVTTTKPKPLGKKDIHLALADRTGLTRQEVASVLDALAELIGQEMGKDGRGIFQMPGLLKLKVVRRPATKAKAGTNPFNGQPLKIAAKPARNAVKITPLKSLRDRI